MNHLDIDRRILTTCRLIARKIETDPEKKGLQKGLENIRKWRINNGHDSPCYQIWEDIILHESWNKIRRILVKDDEKGRHFWKKTMCTKRKKVEIIGIAKQFVDKAVIRLNQITEKDLIIEN